MIPKNLFAVLLLALLLASPAAAIDKGTATVEDVDSYSYEAQDGYVVYEVIVAELPFGTNQTHVYYMDGAEWHIDVNTWSDWAGSSKHASVTVTYPNGTESTQTAQVWSVFGTYQTVIQPVAVQSESFAILKVDLQVGIDPTAASMYWDIPWTAQDAIAFSEVSGSFTGSETSNVYVYWISKEDFLSTISNYNPAAWWASYAGAIFQWSWDMVLAFLGAIPIIGPLFVSLIDIMGTVLTQGYTWVIWLVVNFPAILLSIEAIIILFAIVTAGSGKNSFGKLWRNVYTYNVLFITSFIGVIMFVVEGAAVVINLIINAINGLKPV